MTLPPLKPDDARGAGVQTLVDVLEYRAGMQPDAVIFRSLRGDGTERGALTFAELQRQARAAAAEMREYVVPGDRVVLLVPPGLDYVAAFLSCQYAGVVAVPAYPPNHRRADSRVARIFADCGARVALVAPEFIARLDEWLVLAPELSDVRWLDITRIANGTATWRHPGSTGRSLAMLQYTSGSTAEPRGVMLSHANLLHNLAIIHRVTAHREGDCVVFWLPPFHDMGLIGGILEPIYASVPTILMAPASFLQRPVSWLEAISQYGVTSTGAPNFAYDLCVDRIATGECDGLDLSSLRTSFNGAEPVRADTITRFVERFSPYGLRADVIVPCYGLAEATLFVSGGPGRRPLSVINADRDALQVASLRHGDEPASDVPLVPSGEPDADVEVVIVDPDTGVACPADHVGEIWIAGPSVAEGYWNRPALTETTFNARLTGSTSRFLRSGDLGVFTGQELLVTGRLKDMILIEGRNYYPHDLEVSAARCHEALRPGFLAAFGVPGALRERLILVAEVGRRHDAEQNGALFDAIRAALASDVGVVPDEIILLASNTIPRTSSGKIRRRACRLSYLEGSLESVGQWRAPGSDVAPPAEVVTAFILDWIARELPVEPQRLHAGASARDVGLDSLSVTLLTVALEERLRRRVTPADVWEQPDIRSLARFLTQGDGRGDAPTPRRHFGAPTSASTTVREWPEYRELQNRLEQVAELGDGLPFFRAHEGVPGRTATIDGREVLNFSSYNYLGLAGHPAVIAAAQAAVATMGTSVSASRVVAGERTLHQTLEREIAGFVGVDDALVFVGGHMTNTGTISHLVGSDDVVLCDAWLHNSGMQGAEFSGARRLVFAHNDWRSLDALLTRVREEHRRALVLIEGVYSADGDVPDLAQFIEVKNRHHALLMVDEAHSLGVLGATGRGIAEHAGVDPRAVDIWMGTLSKALASCGGYIAGNTALIEYLKFTSPAFVFSAGMTPANAAAALEALRVLRAEPERVTKLRELAAYFVSCARGTGLNTGTSSGCAVVPVVIGDSALAIRLSARLLEAGVSAAPMVAPAVPEHLARLRFFITTEHTMTDIDLAVRAVAREHKNARAQERETTTGSVR